MGTEIAGRGGTWVGVYMLNIGKLQRILLVYISLNGAKYYGADSGSACSR